MNRYTIKIIAFLIIITWSVGCKKTFDINKNPNQVTEDQIITELIVPSALHMSGDLIREHRLLTFWMGFWSANPTFAPNPAEGLYVVTPTTPEFQNTWQLSYSVLYDLNTIEQKAPTEELDFYAGIAKTIKAKLFQDLVDLYGNVPYSEAFNKEISTPKYDKGEDIYNDLQKVLDEAISIFKEKTAPLKAQKVDIMFSGDANLWIKYANTLKLKLLINQSEITGVNPTAELNKITSNGGVLMSGQTAKINPGYQNATGQQSPFYRQFGYDVNGAESGQNIRANNYLLNVYKQNNDARMPRVFKPAAAPLNPSDPYTVTDLGAPSSSTLLAQNVSYVGPGLARSPAQNHWLTTSVESMFLYAEAVARGWLAGDEKMAYENAVRESFIWLEVPSAVAKANEYLQESAIAKWENSGTTVAQKTRFIGYQKYIAMAGVNSIEAWNLYRRLGVPVNPPLSVNPNKLGNGNLPSRYLYPSREYAVNATNVLAEGTINQFTSKVFWDK